jgi:small subunit ribosomal protein S2
MEDYIFHVKKNQLAVIDLSKTDQQIREASEFLSDYEPEDILVVGRKEEVRDSIERLSDALGFDCITGRFMPGTLTNPKSDSFREPEVIVTTDPETDAQAIEEASETNVPVISIADSENQLENIEVVIPGNNKAEKAVATIMYLLGREYSENTGTEFDFELDDFAEVEEEETDE